MKLITKRKDKLDARIDEVLDRMEYEPANTDDYEKMAKNVETLYRVKNSRKLSKDAIFAGVINIAGICLVLFWEEGHIVAKKAWGLISKGRI